jgi:hypothetical protein
MQESASNFCSPPLEIANDEIAALAERWPSIWGSSCQSCCFGACQSRFQARGYGRPFIDRSISIKSNRL